MKLIYRIALRLTLILVPLILLWGLFFYFSLVNEINDEADDALERYSEKIIRKTLTQQDLSRMSDGSNNSYYITPVDIDYVLSQPQIVYYDTLVNVGDLEEEPARAMKAIFKNEFNEYYELTVMMPTCEKEDLLGTIVNLMLLLYVVLLLSVLFVVMIMLYYSMKPLYKILRWLDLYTPGNQHYAVPKDTSIPEFK